MIENFNNHDYEFSELPPLSNIAKPEFIKKIIIQANQNQKNKISYADFIYNYKLDSSDEDKRKKYLNTVFCAAISELQQLKSGDKIAEFETLIAKIHDFYLKNYPLFDEDFREYYKTIFNRINMDSLDKENNNTIKYGSDDEE